MRSLSEDAARSVVSVLARISDGDLEQMLVDRFYDRFFAQNPEVVPLFGAYAVAEREEMIQETLRSLLAHCEGEPWLEANLQALGRSHAEYGVEAAMYPAYVAELLETLREVLGEAFSAQAEKHVGEALEEICRVMNAAGEGAIP